MNGELEVKINLLRRKADGLHVLAEKIKGQNFDVSFQQGSGNLVNEFVNTAEELKNVGMALSHLCDMAAIRVKDAANQFEFADNLSAGMFKNAIVSIGEKE